jgi:hypothetical protein
MSKKMLNVYPNWNFWSKNMASGNPGHSPLSKIVSNFFGVKNCPQASLIKDQTASGIMNF